MSIDFLIAGMLYLGAGVAPTVVLYAARRRLGALQAASWMVVWGAIVATFEHGFWVLRSSAPGSFGIATSAHIHGHVFMAGVYTVLGGTLLCLVARTLLLQGRRAGWYAVLLFLVAGFGPELVANGPTGLLFQHGFPPESIPAGQVLYAYPIAWLAALAVSYPEVFRASSSAGR